MTSLLDPIALREKETFTTLCRLLSADSNPEDLDLCPIKLNLLIEEAKWHRVLPLVIGKIRAWEASNHPLTLSSEAHEGFGNAERAIKNMISIQMLELKLLSSLLHESNIHFMVLKGIPLSFILYGQLQSRISKDLDILVPEDKLDKVFNILKKAGYKFDQIEQQKEIDRLNFSKYQNQFIAIHENRNVCIEIHWSHTKNPYVFAPSFEEAWTVKTTVALPNCDVYTLPMEETLLYLSAHFCRSMTLRLKWLCDIDRLLRNQSIDIEKLERLAKKYNCRFALMSAQNLSESLLDTPVRVFTGDKCYGTRIYINSLCSMSLLKNHSGYSTLSILRLLLTGDNLQIFLHDFNSIFGPKFKHSQKSKLLSIFFLYFYAKRLLELIFRLFSRNIKAFGIRYINRSSQS